MTYLLIDVDGPLNPYAAKPHQRPIGYSTHKLNPTGWVGKPLRVWLNHNHGKMILDFCEKHSLEPVWATTWEHDANEMIGPHIGLPKLPVIEFGSFDKWKCFSILKFAGNKRIVWLDDDFTIYKKEVDWLYHHKPDSIFYLISPKIGLTQNDLNNIERIL